jgi:type I restriction enzyme S subunit
MELVELGKVFKISSGETPSRKREDFYSNGKISWVKTGDLKIPRLKNVNEFITDEALNISSSKLFPKKYSFDSDVWRNYWCYFNFRY